MGWLWIQVLLGLLASYPVTLEATEDSDLHLQHVHPGCRSSLDQPVMSLPQCNRTSFLSELTTSTSEFRKYNLSTTQLRDCFATSDNINLPSALSGLVAFNGTTPLSISGKDCLCTLNVSGPVGIFFWVQILHSTSKIPPPVLFFTDDAEGFRRIESLVSTKNNFLTLLIVVEAQTQLSFHLSFRAAPECERQLQIKCVSERNGYIETPGWGTGNKYLNHTESCVTLHVPEDHVTMISLVNLEFEQNSSSHCFDTLRIYKTDNCSGQPEKEVCQARQLIPTVLNDTSVVSIRLSIKSNRTRAGFRLLYSFHGSSERPQQLSNGQWDCSVSYYDSFQQHFVCLAEAYCSDRRDQVLCPENYLCGFNVMRLATSCYQLFRPLEPLSWNVASDSCRLHGGGLATMNEVAELTSAAQFPAVRGAVTHVYVGLRMTSSLTSREMYQDTWVWSDGSLAFYLPITFNDVKPPYCAAFYDSSLTTIYCDNTTEAAFLCESVNSTSKHATAISVNTSFVVDDQLYSSCQGLHITHAFLECDVSASCWAANLEESKKCSKELSPPVPFYTCRNRMERVPYTMVCDFRSDCCDDSDEDFCKFPECELHKQSKCSDEKQCVLQSQLCDKRSDCVDGSDEKACDDTKFSDLQANKVGPPALINFTGRGDFTVTITTTFCPDSHFKCPGAGFCVPVYVRCNGMNDCPGHEDEMDCDSYSCPGFYRCRKSKICVHKQHLCDDIFQCPLRDDELMCRSTCPDGCKCYGYAFICDKIFNASIHFELRYLDAKGTKMTPGSLRMNTKLVFLSLRECMITELRQLDFPNLQHLDLSYNSIGALNNSQFIKLENLLFLSLAYNNLTSLQPSFYSGLKIPGVTELDLSGIVISEIEEGFLDTFPNVQCLNMSHSGLTRVSKVGFQSLTSLQTLDLLGCPMEIFFPNVFDGLNQLHTVYSDNYKLCCPENLPEGMDHDNCFAPFDEISSCDALLRADVYRVFLGVYAVLSLTGNLGSFVYRVFIEKNAAKIGYEVFVTHLSVADFLMGIYLAIIGIADIIYYGTYRWQDMAWKSSVACNVAGFFSFVSSEVSAFLICLITLERLLVIRFPFRYLHFSQRFAHALSAAVWLVGVTLALVPLVQSTSDWHFYGQTGICIPLPITRIQFDGWGYAFGVMIVMNFVLFLFIAVGQILIYQSIRTNSMASKDDGRRARERIIARRLLAVVMTDFICWFPIGVLGMMAHNSVPIPGNVNVAIAIFVLPFNSALNPFLYTINVVLERRRNASETPKSGSERQITLSTNAGESFDAGPAPANQKDEIGHSAEEAFQLFKSFLEDGLLAPEMVRRRVGMTAKDN